MWLQHVQMMDTNRLPKQALHYKLKDEGTYYDRTRGGGTNCILRTKEQEARLILLEHDGEVDDDNDECCFIICSLSFPRSFFVFNKYRVNI
jgi:hypothetical protein